MSWWNTNHIREGPDENLAKQMIESGWRAARSIGASSAEADDAVQTALENILSAWRDKKIQDVLSRSGTKGILAYVAASAKNAHRSNLRSRSRSVARQRNYTSDHERVRPRDTSGIEAMLGRELIVSLLPKLPNKQRVCAELIWIHGFTINDVAAVLGVQPQTVRKHMRNANERLRREISKKLD